MISLLSDDWRKQSPEIATVADSAETAEPNQTQVAVGKVGHGPIADECLCDECRLDSIDYFQIEGAKARERLEGGR